MKIAITTRIVEASGYVDPRDALSHDWVRALDELGVTPLLVPNVLRDPVAFLRGTEARGLLLSNGDDLASSPRDRSERLLLEHALAVRLPVLGACRGAQLVAAHFGARITAIDGHVAAAHEVELEEPLTTLVGERRIRVNSFHRHAVRRSDLPAELSACALADDGVVEAFQHRSLPVWGMQWHPERPSPMQKAAARLLEHWLEQCRRAP